MPLVACHYLSIHSDYDFGGFLFFSGENDF
jgi:hypothetical protein